MKLSTNLATAAAIALMTSQVVQSEWVEKPYEISPNWTRSQHNGQNKSSKTMKERARSKAAAKSRRAQRRRA